MTTQGKWMHIWSASRYALSLDSRTRLIIEYYKETSKHQLWRLEDNGQLRNQAVGLDWELGKDKWKRENNYLVHEKSGKVLDVEGGSSKSGGRVIVYQKHGGNNQRWYFDHDNADKKYFICSQVGVGQVIDIAGSAKRGGKLLSYQGRIKNNANQTWNMNRMGRLLSGIGSVADIEGGSIKVGANVIAWDFHGGNNQLWTMEDGRLRSNHNNLVMEAGRDGQIRMASKGDRANQQWLFVPVELLERFKFVQENSNPLLEAAFYKEIYDNYFWAVCGFVSIHAFRKAFEDNLKTIRESGKQLDKVAHDTGIAQTAGGGAAIAGGIMGLAGILLAPFTAGASLGLTIAGTATGVAGGVSSLTGNLIKQGWEKEEMGVFQSNFAKARTSILRLQSFIRVYLGKIKEAKAYMETKEGLDFAKDALKLDSDWSALEAGYSSLKVGMELYKFGKAAVKTIDVAKTVRGVKTVAEFIQADYYVVKGAMTGAATHASRPAVPLLDKIGVKALQTGGKAAGALGAVFNVLGIAFGIMDVVDGADNIKNGSQLAKEFFKTANDLEAWLHNLCEFDEKLQK